jgi:hypothetical protein
MTNHASILGSIGWLCWIAGTILFGGSIGGTDRTLAAAIFCVAAIGAFAARAAFTSKEDEHEPQR